MSGARYDAVLFDFHGTLAYTPGLWGTLYGDALAEHGYRFEVDEISRAVLDVWDAIDGPDGIEHVEFSTDAAAYDRWRTDVESRWLRALGVEPSDALLRAIFERQDSPARFALFDDVLPTLEALRQSGVRTGVISNFSWRLPDAAQHLGVGALVEFVLTSAQAGYRKPHPEIFRRGLAFLGAAPARALYVGDSYLPDVHGPRRAGMDAVLLDRSGRARYDCPSIRSLREIVALVARD